MIEILIVWSLCKKMGNTIRAKGRAPFGYQFMLVVFWLGGEFMGGVGAAIYEQVRSGGISDELSMTVYLFALVGAVVGACFAFGVAHMVSDISQTTQREGAYDCPGCGEPTNDPTLSCGVCGHTPGAFDSLPD